MSMVCINFIGTFSLVCTFIYCLFMQFCGKNNKERVRRFMLGKGWKTRNNSFVDLTSPYGIVVQKSGGMVDQNVISKRSPMPCSGLLKLVITMKSISYQLFEQTCIFNYLLNITNNTNQVRFVSEWFVHVFGKFIQLFAFLLSA